MKIFAVYFSICLPREPDWLIKFREKYDEPFETHITLKQPCFIAESELPLLKQQLKAFVKNNNLKKIPVEFSKVVVDESDTEKNIIMLTPKDSVELIALQRKLIKVLSSYNDYFDINTIKYETDFNPHITIAHSVVSQKLEKVLLETPDKFSISGYCDKLVLIIVKEATVKERKDPNNLIIFYLN